MGGSNQPKNTAFKQQRLPAWQPVLTAKNVLPTFLIVGFLFIPLGVVLLITSNNCFEKTVTYTECSPVGSSDRCYDIITQQQIQANPPLPTDCQCEIEFEIEQDVEGPVYFYYKLTNFFQNHRVYVKSRDNKQLSGSTDITASNLDSSCEPFRTQKVKNSAGEDVEVPIAPCGTIANSLFNDTFRVTNLDNNNKISINKRNIAWKTDHTIKFQNPEYEQCDGSDLKCNFGADNNGVQQTAKPLYWSQPVYNVSNMLNSPLENEPSQNGYENEALEVWMRTAAFPTFRKLYGTGRVDRGRFRACSKKKFLKIELGLNKLAPTSSTDAKNRKGPLSKTRIQQNKKKVEN